ncbi:hypothetical protein COU57_04080 [Candidatus Pacearchaeota archaeon CG10_big_fil_rev_8_21_14_0_10_32_14]|nr:MAG: hypothetical protein COU57_04080 [Candidatus Pacearchaeota archaeon CG10_big_fil_rev_8_21_14_0_10_32_14]
MKRGAIVLIFIISLSLILNNISAESSIKVDYPDEVNSGEEFTFRIELVGFGDDNANYDAKIDILDDHGTRIGKIYDDNKEKWQTTYYYVNGGIKNSEGEFNMKVENYDGKGKIEIKIRKNGGSSSKSFTGYEINVNGNSNNKDDEEKVIERKVVIEKEKDEVKNTKREENNEIEKPEEEVVEGTKKEVTKISYNEINKISQSDTQETGDEIEVIKLSQNIKSDFDENSEEKNSNNFAFKGLMVFSLVLAGLYGLRYGKKYIKKEHGIV